MLLARSWRVCPFCQLSSLPPTASTQARLPANLKPWSRIGSPFQLRQKGGPGHKKYGASRRDGGGGGLAARTRLPVNIGPGSAGSRVQKQSDTRRRIGPFAAMNRTTPPPALAAGRSRDKRRTERTASAGSDAVSVPQSEKHMKPKPRLDKNSDRKNKKSDEPFQPRALKMQRALAHVDYETRTKVKSSLQDIDSFNDFDLLPVVRDTVHNETLGGLTDISPTPIQRLAIPALLRRPSSQPMQQYLLAAETGSGKTLAYVLPIVDAIKRAELAEEASEDQPVQNATATAQSAKNDLQLEPPTPNLPHPTTARPRGIVLVPTTELVEQIGRVFKTFAHTAKLRVELLSTSYSATVIRNRLFSTGGIDIVVSTPQLLKSIVESEPNILSRVSHLVVDEADSLFDRSFTPFTSAIIDRASPSLNKLILCSATIPKAFDKFLTKRFPEMTRFAAPNLHAIPRRVQLTTVDIDKDPYQGNRDLACADTIWQIGQPSGSASSDTDDYDPAQAKRVLVFVNQREKSNELASYLVTKGVDAVALHRDTRGEKSAKILSAFTSSSTAPVSNAAKPDSASRASQPPRILNNVKVLVMTDLGSRGIDTVAVRNVVLYDVPNTSVDFIHRLGRTGRMGRRGRAVVLIGKKDRRDIVSEVRQSMFRGQALV